MLFGGQPAPDPVARSCPSCDQTTCAGPLLAQQHPAIPDLAGERPDLADQRRVLLRDRVDRLDAGDQVVEAVRPEQNCKGGLLVFRRVDRDEPRGQRALREREIPVRDAERLPVDCSTVLSFRLAA